ncbi:uroporphyrinogen-III synthase [Terribacillus sp. 179-K 1B1 HS]|uniref:uroporphyrinogen-III synthase n=1 Tax=Terribacillus sp. 179-K 1B1 HS TaxID=3142388 RepID=UPI0039A040E4
MSRLPAVKVLVTRPKPKAVHLAEELAEAGAKPIIVPLLTFHTRIDDENVKLCQEGERFDWLFFSSTNGVEHFHALLSTYSSLEAWSHCHIAAVGQKTAEAIARLFGREADLVPDDYTADALAARFTQAHDPDSRILLIQGNLSRPALANGLKRNGFVFEKMVVYDTVEEISEQELLNDVLKKEQPEVLTFTSPSSIKAFLAFIDNAELEQKQLDKLCLVIGPTTEEAAKRHGFRNILLPAQYTADAMIDLLVHFYEQRTGE